MKEYKNPFKQYAPVFIIVICIIIPLLNNPGIAAPEKKILIMYPSQRGMPWYENLHGIFQENFKNSPGMHINTEYEYLDLMRNQNAEYKQILFNLLNKKYSGKKYDLIITMNESLDFLRNERKTLFPGVPVIFSSSALYAEKIDQKKENLSGIVHDEQKSMVLGTLETALKLLPDTKKVVIISGTDETSRYREIEARKAYSLYEHSISFFWLSGKPMDEILEIIKKLDDDTIIIYFFMITDGAGINFIPIEAGRMIIKNSNRPVFGIIDTLIGSGITGGYMNSSIPQGRGLSSLAYRVLNGERPASIPIGTYSYAYLFDWRQLKKYRIDENLLPSEAIVMYKEPDFWETYKWQIITVISICIIEMLLIIALIGNIIKRREAEAKLKHSYSILEIKVQERTAELSEINKKLEMEIQERIKAELSQKELISKLQTALDEIRTLQGILPICSSCKKIRNDEGYWEQIESYFNDHIGTEFSHGLCPDCARKLYPGINTIK